MKIFLIPAIEVPSRVEVQSEDDSEGVPSAGSDDFWLPLSVELHGFLKLPRTIIEIEIWGRGRSPGLPPKFRTLSLLHQTLAWLSFKGLAKHVAPFWHQALPAPVIKPEISGYSGVSHAHLHSFGSDD